MGQDSKMPDAGIPSDQAVRLGGGLLNVDFSENGNSALFLRDGWSGQERSMVWAIGPRSSLALTIPAFGRPLVLEFEVIPCRYQPVPAGQIIRISVNGVLLGTARVMRLSMVRCEISPDLINETGSLTIDFDFPVFYRPSWLRYAGDSRPLSAAFRFLRIYTKDIMRPGSWCEPSEEEIPTLGLEPPLSVDEPPGGAAQPACYSFGPHGSVKPFLKSGWDPGEKNFNWTAAQVSEVDLPPPATPGGYVLRIDVTPAVAPRIRPTQDLTVLLDGFVLAHFTIGQPSTLIVPLPRELTEKSDSLPLRFLVPDASRPCDLGISGDRRLLGFAFRRIALIPLPPHLAALETIRTEQSGSRSAIAVSNQFLAADAAELPGAILSALGEGAASLLRHFESLGDNCEFGIVQRKLSLEVFNLLRFGNAQLANLIAGLTDDFAVLNDASSVAVELNDARRREFVVSVPAYKLRWHTFAYEDQTDHQSVLQANAVKLGYLRRKFYEGLRAGRKIYVLKRQPPITLSQAAAVLLELHRHGPATLLCVGPVPEGRHSGEVDLVMPYLMRGYLSEFAPDDDVEAVDPSGWLRLAANAWLLHSAQTGPAPGSPVG
jgi:hypothetical protein